ncbi:MAG TPA: hypothetical protein VK335_06495 [Bryobacteraceae bacterium]|nr:hypothetical protein [Bryobacteraceae bacterium]
MTPESEYACSALRVPSHSMPYPGTKANPMNRSDELRRHAAAEQGGGAERKERQHQEGKRRARKWIGFAYAHLVGQAGSATLEGKL